MIYTYRSNCYSLHVADSSRAAEHPDVGGEWWLEAGLALLPLNGLDERRLLTANVSSCASVHEHVKVIARATGVFADQARLVGLEKYKFPVMPTDFWSSTVFKT